MYVCVCTLPFAAARSWCLGLSPRRKQEARALFAVLHTAQLLSRPCCCRCSSLWTSGVTLVFVFSSDRDFCSILRIYSATTIKKCFVFKNSEPCVATFPFWRQTAALYLYTLPPWYRRNPLTVIPARLIWFFLDYNLIFFLYIRPAIYNAIFPSFLLYTPLMRKSFGNFTPY